MLYELGPGILWAWWIRFCLESAFAVRCLGTWVTRRLGGCRRCGAPSRSQPPSTPVPPDLQKFWRAVKLARDWKEPRRTKQGSGAVKACWRNPENQVSVGWQVRAWQPSTAPHFPAEAQVCLLLPQRLPQAFSLNRVMGTFPATEKPLSRENLQMILTLKIKNSLSSEVGIYQIKVLGK